MAHEYDADGLWRMRDRILTAYEECADWADAPRDENGDEEDSIGWAHETFVAAAADVDAFLSDETITADLLLWLETFGPEQIGHDLWLTRNRHGAGFWDRDLSGGRVTQAGKRLTDAADAMGECSLYVGADRLVYVL